MSQEFPFSENRSLGFLEVDVTPASFADALFHILPVPLEKSVSYGNGTSRGPAAILDASQQLEVFDGLSSPALSAGIFTDDYIDCDFSITRVLDEIEQSVEKSFKHEKIPVLLGGEHTVTVGVLKALKDNFEEIGIIQFDAHADLRDTYEETPLSHACVMKRVYDAEIPFYQVGVRALSQEEEDLRADAKIPHLDAREIYQKGQKSLSLPKDFPKKVYVTIDVDGLDPSVIPGTGTPVPGGIQWYDMLNFLQQIVDECEVVGFDCVELAPSKDDRQSSFAAAQLIYAFMGMISRGR